MSDKEVVKQAFAEAEKEAREKQVGEVKRIVVKTLEKLEDVRKNLKKLQEEEKILKMDIDDLKDGRLDRISERQEKDPESKKVSVVLIIKEKEVIREVSPWYWPYTVVWQQYIPQTLPGTITYCGSGTSGNSGWGGTSNCLLSTGDNIWASATASSITCSVAKDATVGAYAVGDHVVHLR